MPRNSRRDEIAHPAASKNVEKLLSASTADVDSQAGKRPWSIKGIDEATVQLCKLAARGKGMKINRWVEDALSSAAQQELGPASTESHAPGVSNILDRISRLEGEVNALAKSHAAVVTALVSR